MKSDRTRGDHAAGASDESPLARILVLGPESATDPARQEALEALERLGADVEVMIADELRGALTVLDRRNVDLVVVDRGPSGDAALVLEALRDCDPPVVVVSRSDRDDDAVAAFGAGAADCVRHGAGFDEALAAVALEQIRRFRSERERGATESRIAWLERLNDTIVTALPAALAVIDGRHRFVSVNPEFALTFEVEAEAVRGEPLESVLPEDLVRSGELTALLAETEAQRDSAPRLARWHDGSRSRAHDVRARRLDEEGDVVLVLSDVSEREKLSRRVEDLRRYNENIIRNLNSALIVVDTAGQIRFGNATAEELLGAPRGALRGRSAWDWFDVHARDGALLQRTLDEGLRFKGAETVIRRPDGRVVPIGISCAPLVDGQTLRGAVAIFQDLTEIKQLQRQVLQTEKMASIGQLAAGVAHEINNPMGFIHANLFQMSEYLGDLRNLWERIESLSKVAAEADSEEVRDAAEAFEGLARELDIRFVLGDFGKAIRESQEGSERIRHIVQDLRDFSHQDTAERVPADVNQCVDSTASIVWTMMKHSVVLQKEYCDLPPVHCFPMQLKQVFMNLLVNAYQAIDERIGDSGETGEIVIRTALDGQHVVVSIRDTGAGIPSEHLERIFDPFFTTKEVGAGTGLGLSTSYSIVQRHGGTIRVDSTPGEGSTFEVRLPVSGPAVAVGAVGEGERRG
ncbi:MAG: hybrid sensor histidine kinase/response regulator [Myxococcota bacterium]